MGPGREADVGVFRGRTLDRFKKAAESTAPLQVPATPGTGDGIDRREQLGLEERRDMPPAADAAEEDGDIRTPMSRLRRAGSTAQAVAKGSQRVEGRCVRRCPRVWSEFASPHDEAVTAPQGQTTTLVGSVGRMQEHREEREGASRAGGADRTFDQLNLGCILSFEV